jgi:magnesium chelatase accessory protein
MTTPASAEGRGRKPRRGGPKAGAKLKHDLANWPNSEFSRFVHAAGLDWHVQVAGRGPVLLLVHGAGAAVHSWRDLFPLLARRFKVVAVDLPGHGFTDVVPSRQASLSGMAMALGKLLHVMHIEPAFAVGHSAGAAILTRMCLDGSIAPRGLMSINGAFKPFGSVTQQIFSPLAKLLALNPFVPRLFAWGGFDRNSVARTIRDTGSHIDNEGIELYARLVREPRHISGALTMMANWDLSSLVGDMRRLQIPLTLVVGLEDKAVPPEQADAIAQIMPNVHLVRLPGLGHLAHEENPREVVRLIFDMAGVPKRRKAARTA